MNFFYGRILLFLITLSLVFSLVGCDTPSFEETVTGIQIDADSEYSNEVLNQAEQTIFSLVVYTYQKAVMEKIPPKVESRLIRYAQRICEITAANPIPEEQYRSAIALFEKDGRGVIDEWIASKNGDEIHYEKTRAFYLNLTYLFGADQVASMLYDFCIMIYDAQYERTIEKFETYQYPWYQEEAEALAAEKIIFLENIGRESFSTLVRCSTAMAELLATKDVDKISETFSDAEILEIIRHLDVSKIDIDEAGWELLLSYSFNPKEGSYFAKLVTVFEESGDLSRLATVMNDAIILSASVMEKLMPEDIAALRTGKNDAILNSIYSRFDDDDWALFESLTSLSLANQQYSSLAGEEYGEAYWEYVAAIEKVDLSILRTSIGTAEFHQNLSSYLASICPAISYEVNS